VQGQTFEHFIIDLCQPPNNVQLNMHNIYITLSRLYSLNGFVNLRNITIQDICKANFKIGSLEMTSIVKSKIEQMNTPICHNENKQMQHEFCKKIIDNIIERDDDSNDVTNDDAIHYWHEKFQLIKEDENKLFNPHGWLIDQHLGTSMQICIKIN
jgi:hypothetical protein